MVEVFKTDVTDQHHANMLIDQIQKNFAGYTVNFDLEDCDKILRVKSTNRMIESGKLISLFKHLGFNAELLPDDPVLIGNTVQGGEMFSNN